MKRILLTRWITVTQTTKPSRCVWFVWFSLSKAPVKESTGCCCCCWWGGWLRFCSKPVFHSVQTGFVLHNWGTKVKVLSMKNRLQTEKPIQAQQNHQPVEEKRGKKTQMSFSLFNVLKKKKKQKRFKKTIFFSFFKKKRKTLPVQRIHL